jgi:DNA invertase Pin-like site-specific DNA recombinase
MKAIGYVRVSTQEQAEEGASLEAQQDRIKAWCLANEYELSNVYIDAGISGKGMNRQGLKDALAEVDNNSALVACSLSRISRSTKDMLTIAETLESKGADLVSLSERIDTTSAAGKMVFKMLAVLNEFERDLVSERTKAVLAHKKAKGEKYGTVPFGYREVDGRLIEVQSELDILADIVLMRNQGKTLRCIAGYLNDQGIKGKSGGKWYASTISYILKSRMAA